MVVFIWLNIVSVWLNKKKMGHMTYKNRYYFSTVKDKPYHEIFTDHWFSKNEVYVVWLLLVIFQHCKNIVDASYKGIMNKPH